MFHIDPDGGANHLCDCTTECKGVPPVAAEPAGRRVVSVLGAALCGATVGIGLAVVLLKLLS